jgi:2-polyprenyl-6-methoxyphenol hydroxylase-like FAD-dependent oxidoreductase
VGAQAGASIGGTDETRVLIVGGGPVGLAAALELARFGVPSVVIEKRPGTSWHPKTRNFNTRTMEIARGWGRLVYERLRAIDTPPGWKSPIRFLRSATGEQFGEIESRGFEGPGPEISPALPVMSSQELFEEILCDACATTGLVDLRFGQTVTRVIEGGAPEDAKASIAVQDAAGRGSELTGSALVAADGIDSLVREQLGIPLAGDQSLHHFVNCYFRAEIEPRLQGRTGVLLFVANEGAGGVLQPLDAKGRWLCQIAVGPEDWSTEAWPAERVQDWMRAAAGVETLDVEVLSVGRWRMNAAVAERLVQGRVVLCGDAAHQFPPTGGLGVNTGLQGMHNAIWKLAMCVRGEAGWPLLDTYEAERREPAVRTARQSLENHRNVGLIAASAFSQDAVGMSPDEAVRTARRYGNHLGVEFGTRYESTAVIADSSAPPEVDDDYSDYVPSGTPGCRAPHAWLSDGRLSTLDLFGPGFTLLAGPDGEMWCEATRSAAAETRIAAYRFGAAGLGGNTDEILGSYGITSRGAVLVRPDGYIAWRSRGESDEPHAELSGAVATILARE